MVEIQTTEYLAQLLKDKKQIAAFPNVFIHLERILDEGTKLGVIFFPKAPMVMVFSFSQFFRIKRCLDA